MSNNQLPDDVRERIKADAAKSTNKRNESLRYQSKDYGRRISFIDGYEQGYVAGATTEAQCKLKHDELVAENEALRRWKEEATRLLSNIYAYSGRHPEMKLGQDTVEFVIARAKERDALKERCEKMEAALRQFISYHETGLLPNVFTYKKGVEALKEGESNTPAHGEGKEVVKIKTGLMFRNVHMPNHSFEIHSVDPANNKLAVNIRSANRLCWTEIDWNLEHTQWAFEKGEYYIPK